MLLLSSGQGKWVVLDPVPHVEGEWTVDIGLGFVTRSSGSGFRYREHVKSCTVKPKG